MYLVLEILDLIQASRGRLTPHSATVTHMRLVYIYSSRVFDTTTQPFLVWTSNAENVNPLGILFPDSESFGGAIYAIG